MLYERPVLCVLHIEPAVWPSWCSVRVGDVLVVGSSPAGAVRSRVARGCAAASATEATVASRGEQGRAGVRAVRGAPDFFDGLGQWACQEAAGREKLGSKTPAPAQEVGVSRRRPLARAPCLRGSECFSTGRHQVVQPEPGCSQPYLSDCIREYLTEATKKQEKYPPTWSKAGQ